MKIDNQLDIFQQSGVFSSAKVKIFVDTKNRNLAVKFTYAGNTQYHKMSFEEAKKLSDGILSVVEPVKEYKDE